MALISVIVPVYGVEKYLKEAVNSILNQTMADMEIILIDDGSKDKCPDIIDEYASKDNRIIAIHKQNGGYGQTMNAGLNKATGEYIAILEPDDYIDSKMYEDLYKIAKEFDSDIVKSCFYDNLQSKQLTRIKKVKWNDYIPEDKSFTIKEYPYFLYYHPSIWSCIYKKEFLDKNNIRFVEAPGSGWTDNPFQVQTMCLAERINFTKKAYYYWRRVNECDCDDLKDYRIPFLRTQEIHKWLSENNIADKEILLHLYRREASYCHIVLGMKKISDKKDCYSLIKDVIDKIPEKEYLNSKDVRNDEKRVYHSFKKNLEYLRLKILFKRARRWLISIRLNKYEKRINLFGKSYIFNNKAGKENNV